MGLDLFRKPSTPAGGTRNPGESRDFLFVEIPDSKSIPDIYGDAFLVMYIVYVISSFKRNYIYVGLTSDLDKRLETHNKGYEKNN